MHSSRHGVSYRWDSPPDGGHPGEAIRCRCVAEPVLDSDKNIFAPQRNSFKKLPEDDIIASSNKYEEVGQGMERKKANAGEFAKLEVPMQKRAVEQICREYGVNISGLTIKIQRDEGMLYSHFTGSTDYDDIGRIDLFPNAFTNKEQLLRTIIHEKAHVKQLTKYVKDFAQANIDYMEKIAYRYESLFYLMLKKRRSVK